MLSLLANSREFIIDMYKMIDEHSKPDPKYFDDHTTFEITHVRYKTAMTIYLLLILFFIGGFFLFPANIVLNIVRILLCVFLILVQFASCKSHPRIFKGIVSAICLLYGPIVMVVGGQSIVKLWTSALILPILAFIFTGSLRYFLFQTCMQLVYTNTLYIGALIKSLTILTPEAFTDSFASAFNMYIIHLAVLVIIIYNLLQKAFRKIAVVEKKKEEIENQKNFLLGFSHELRNLINSLAGNVKLASLEGVTGRAKELLLNAEVCGEMLLHLVNNILDTGKVEIGELEINPAPTNIYEALERVWGVCSELIQQKSLNGKMSIQKSIPRMLMIDHYRLTQIFLNLIGNAVKFTERGSVEVSITWMDDTYKVSEECFQPYPYNYYDDHDEGLFEKHRVLSSLDKNTLALDLKLRKVNSTLLKEPLNTSKGILKVSISDTGCGMTEQETSKLFQKFTQVSSDPSKRKLGTGLGLFITKQLCQRMQGEVKVFSEKNTGSCFIFCIPVDVLTCQNEHISDIQSTKCLLKQQKLKVMIVDDTTFNHAVLKSFFTKIDIEVKDIAVDGRDAYRRYIQSVRLGERPDIVTMDLDMPVMNGKEASRLIREYENKKGLRPCFLLIISGNCTESEIDECLSKSGEVKADEFLKKPVSIEQILRVIGHHFIHK